MNLSENSLLLWRRGDTGTRDLGMHIYRKGKSGATSAYTGHILRDVDRWSYLDEIADKVSKVERNRHTDELKERRQRQDQDLRQNRREKQRKKKQELYYKYRYRNRNDAMSGGLIFNYECNVPKIETEKTFGYPLDLKLNYENKKIVVEFGQRDGVMVGHVLTAVNGIPATGRQLDDGRDVFDIINERENYPLSLKFARLRMTTNEKIFLASMFYPLFAIASQLSPEPRCSGIEVLEADTFKLQCFQTLTGIFCALLNTDLMSDKLSLLYSCFGVKFMVVAEPTQAGLDILLRRIYELYSDFALKNPFYSLEMPIRCELFDSNLQNLLEHVEKTGISNV
uniref:Trafficking protein particle complex subunit 4 n=1 Tax=Timema tahoe TaxID=61484 RepID=A0A7R9FL10_9NEOP|nr:unnamed protein product [Timema tahoe]